MKLTGKFSYYLLDKKAVIALKEFFAEQQRYDLASELRSIEIFYDYVDTIINPQQTNS